MSINAEPVDPPERLTTFSTMAAGGDAIGRLSDGRVVFVPDALPSEVVEVAITEHRRDYARGRLETVIEPSPYRVSPPCRWRRAGCGGCPWQHVVPGGPQLAQKSAMVGDALRRLAKVQDGFEWLPGWYVPADGYRTTVHLGVEADGRPGYHRPRSRRLVAVDDCLVAHPLLAEMLSVSRFPGWGRVTLRAGVASGQRLAVCSDPMDGAGRPALPEVPDDCQVVTPGRSGSVTEEVGGRAWRVSARSFFQSGPQAADLLAQAVGVAAEDALDSGTTVVDAYAGVGLLGGTLVSGLGSRLIAVESHADAVKDARVNLADLDATVVSAEVGRWDAQGLGAVGVMVADPARPGLGRPGVDAVRRVNPARLVLVSCDPASMARDTALLRAAGYRLTSVRVLDLFPHTAHVEAVARFDRETPGKPVSCADDSVLVDRPCPP